MTGHGTEPPARRSGPLNGVTVVEVGGIGPGPFAAMLLADMGADVVRIERPTGMTAAQRDTHQVLLRGRTQLQLDLKSAADTAELLELFERADVIIEGFRPGVMERLGLGPEEALKRNPRVVYGRMTGWGQRGPLADYAGHDINYIALSGALEPIVGEGGRPAIPLNLVGDFGGGGMLLAVGILAALAHVNRGGDGQIVDAAIVDGAALLLGMHFSMLHTGMWNGERGENLFDGGAPHYGVYQTADQKWLAVGAIEPQFYQQFIEGLGLSEQISTADQLLVSTWPQTRALIAGRVAELTRDEWVERFDGRDACVSPVLSPQEAALHPHNTSRGTFQVENGLLQPSPAPRFTPAGGCAE